MARPPRIHYEGALYHVYSRGNGGKNILIDDDDKRFFLALLLDLKRRMELKCHFYCLMTNHFHLLLEVGKFPLSRLMQSALSRYAQHFNFKYDTFGHVFQGRPGAILCLRDSYYIQLIRYVHLNPVAAGIVATPDAWPWSSHRCLAWDAPDPLVDRKTVLSAFSPDIKTAEAEYRRFVQSGHPVEFRSVPKGAPPIQARQESHDLSPIAARAANAANITVGQMQSPTQIRTVTSARHEFILAAWQEGFASAEIARFLGQGRSTVAEVIKGKSSASLNL